MCIEDGGAGGGGGGEGVQGHKIQDFKLTGNSVFLMLFSLLPVNWQ